jgi:hypothetical protein
MDLLGNEVRTANNPHLPTMYFRDKSSQVVGCAEAIVELADVLYPIPVVGVAIRRTRSLIVLVYGANPNCGTR